jgi:CheY-like chemotaxis protein
MAPATDTILVVDDEPEVRSVLAGMLREMGFTVLEASSGPEALELSAKHRGEIHLLLTDLIMPGMTGRLLADTLLAQRPGMDVIFMSGYVDDSRQGTLEPGLHYIQKPVDWHKLEKKVKEALEKRRRKG